MRRYSFEGLIFDFCKKYMDKSAFKYRPKDEKEEKKYGKYVIKTYRNLYDDLLKMTAYFKKHNITNMRVSIVGRNSYIWSLIMMTTLITDNIVVPLDKELKNEELLSSISRAESDIVFYDSKFEKKVLEVVDLKNSNLEKEKENENEKLDNKKVNCISFEDVHKYVEDEEETKKLDFQKLSLEYKQRMDENEKKFKKYEKTNSYEALKNKPKDFKKDVESLEDVKVMLFTSGTTAMSKLVLLTRENIITNVYDVCEHEKIEGDNTEIALLPAHHIFGLNCILVMKHWGVETTYPDSLKKLASNFKEYKVTIFVGVPLILEAIYSRIKKTATEKKKWFLLTILRKFSNFLRIFKIDARKKLFKSVLDPLGGNLKYVISGAAALNPEVYHFFEDIGVQIFPGYGLSETSPVVAAETDEFVKKGSVGIPVRNIEVKIDKNALIEHYKNTLDLSKEENIKILENLKHNDEGEILLRGKSVFKGYYKDLEKTKDSFYKNTRWFRTGDIGTYKNNFLTITGRIKDMIVLGNGKKAFPDELEFLVNSIPEVSESFVFATDKNIGYGTNGELKIYAKIKYDKTNKNLKDKTEEEIKEYLWEEIKKINKTLPSYKIIRGIILTTDDFTKTTTQKIKRFIEKEKIEKEFGEEN